MANTLLTIGTGFGDTMLVCALGIGIVFFGLIALIGLVYLLNYITDKFFSGKKTVAPQAQPAVVATTNTEIPNREEIVAAVVAAIAEEENTDISAIRVLSFKKV